MLIRNYVITHIGFDAPGDPVFCPLQVGAALHEPLGYLRDDTGDQISEKNPTFCELTCLYWIWKNDRDSDIVGTCHYRRYPVKKRAGGMGETYLGKEDIRRILCDEDYDVITSSLLELPGSYYDGFSVDHHQKDLICCEQVIRELYPGDLDTFSRLVRENHTYFGNILIAKKPVYDEYCKWLFSILFEVEKRTDMTGYDGYTRRLYGFLSEFLLYVYVQSRVLRPYECRIAIIGEKAETKEAKEKLALHFRKRDWKGAKESLLACLQKKPDLLMEASDIGGELRLAMQVIATCEHQAENGQTILNEEQDLHALISRMRSLNRAVSVMNSVENMGNEAGRTPGCEISGSKQEMDVNTARRIVEREGDIAVRIAKMIMTGQQ